MSSSHINAKNVKVLARKGESKFHKVQSVLIEAFNRTFNPIKDHNKILDKLEEVAVELENDMRDNGWTGKTVTLKYKLDTYQGRAIAPFSSSWDFSKTFLSLHSCKIFRSVDYEER